MIRESDGKTLIWTSGGYRLPEDVGVVIDNSSSDGGGTGGAITIADGADLTTGSKTDAPATDLANASMMSVLKANTVAMQELVKALGASGAGTSATKALLTGGIYNSALAFRTAGQQGGLETDVRGSVRMRLHCTNGASADGVANNIAFANGENDATGAQRPLASVQYGWDNATSTFNRLRMNSNKGLYVSQTLPDTATAALTAQSISGSTVATASLIGQVDNPGLKFKKAVIHVKNLTTNAFSDLVLKTKCNPSDIGYDQTLAGSQWTAANPYVLELSTDPTILVNAEVRIVLDISIFSSLEIRAVSQTPGTSASLRYFLAEGV
jgi:hypothetical protein